MHALRVIEFEAVLGQLQGHCQTEVGVALAEALSPAFDESTVWARLTQTTEADALVSVEPVSLAGVADVRSAVSAAEKGASLDGETLYQVAASLQAMRTAARPIVSRKSDWPGLGRLAERLPDLPKLESRLFDCLDGDGTVKDSASVALAQARQRKARAGQRILERIQSYVSGRARDLLSDPLYTVRSGRYVLPVKAENKGRIKGIVHDTSASGATVYIEPEDVVALGNDLREAEAAEREEVARVLDELSGRVGQESAAVLEGLDAVAELDLALAKARFGHSIGGCLPRRRPGAALSLVSARHPLLDRSVAVPLDIEIGGPTSVVLITGPNTGGKTVAIKTVGLAVAMAQAGLMPVAKECEIGCFSQIWADIGDEQSLEQSLSTFSGHIKNIAAALQGLRPGGLVLLDEVGAGTDPAEGASLARALLLAFQRGGAAVMASTHFGELKLLAGEQPGFENASMEFDVKSLRPTYRLLLGVPGSSHALAIAERYGIPRPVVEEARSGIGQAEHDVAALIARLEQAQRQAQKAQGEADRVTARLRQVEEEAKRQIEAAEEARAKVRERATTELEALLREIRLEAADIFEELKRDPSQRGFERARRRLKDIQSVGKELADETAPAARTNAPAQKPQSLARGDTVRVDGLSQTGVLLDEPVGRQVQVQVGPMRMTVDVAKLSRLSPAAAAKPQHRAGGDKLRRVMTAATEIHLRQMRAEDAELELSKFLDEAILAGLNSVRIVHGKGEGVLRKLTHDVLRRHKGVKGHSLADPSAGGDGVTIAELR